MNNILEVVYAWFGTLFEVLFTLTCDVVNIIISTLSQTPDSSLGNDASLDTSTSATAASVVDNSDPTPTAGTLISEKTLANLPKFVQDLAAYFTFDDFQFLLLQILIGILIGNICLIYVAWKIYGERITEFFLSDTPNIPPEELQRRIDELDLPRTHSQRY